MGQRKKAVHGRVEGTGASESLERLAERVGARKLVTLQ